MVWLTSRHEYVLCVRYSFVHSVSLQQKIAVNSNCIFIEWKWYKFAVFKSKTGQQHPIVMGQANQTGILNNI